MDNKKSAICNFAKIARNGLDDETYEKWYELLLDTEKLFLNLEAQSGRIMAWAFISMILNCVVLDGSDFYGKC